MALAFSILLPYGGAVPYCDPAVTGQFINAKLSMPAHLSGVKQYYNSEQINEKGSETSINLDENPVIIFSKNKDTLIRCLKSKDRGEFSTSKGFISIIRNNFRPSAQIVGETLLNPFLALHNKRKANWSIFKQAGGFKRENYQEIQEQETGNIVRVESEPLEYVSWDSMYKMKQRVTRVRAGYYILLARSPDLVKSYDVLGKRAFLVERGRITPAGVASLLNHD